MGKILIGFLVFLLSVTNSSFAKEQGSIQIKGSDTIVNLVQSWAESFMQKNPQQFIAVTGGGSGTGIASFINKTTDIAMSSRTIKPKEVDLAKNRGIDPREIKIALDGLAVVVNPANPVDKLTVGQLAEIFTGKVRNWKDLGGPDLKIVLLSREVNSGTHVYFKEHVLSGSGSEIKEFSPRALLMPSSQAIADEVTSNSAAIGYYGMGYISDGQKPVAIAQGKASDYVLPTLENVVQGRYPISRPLYFYTDGEPEGLVKEFIDFALSEKGQRIVVETDFVPIKSIK